MKLQIAVDGFFDENGDHRQEYGKYVHSRILPAAQLLIDREDTEKLQKLWDLGWLCSPDDLLQYAIRKEKMAAFAWLLQYKQNTAGFCRKDLSLQE